MATRPPRQASSPLTRAGEEEEEEERAGKVAKEGMKKTNKNKKSHNKRQKKRINELINSNLKRKHCQDWHYSICGETQPEKILTEKGGRYSCKVTADGAGFSPTSTLIALGQSQRTAAMAAMTGVVRAVSVASVELKLRL